MRFTFADDSCLTVAGDAWDYGYPDCWCWAGLPPYESTDTCPHHALSVVDDGTAAWTVPTAALRRVLESQGWTIYDVDSSAVAPAGVEGAYQAVCDALAGQVVHHPLGDLEARHQEHVREAAARFRWEPALGLWRWYVVGADGECGR